MTKPNDEFLDDLFAVAQTRSPKVSDDLLARVLADAASAQHVPVLAPKQSFIAGFLDLIGGWPSVGGLAMAGVAGLWFGVSPPAAVSTWTADLFGTAVTVDLLGDTSEYFAEALING
ncbi:hypothetical protein [Yoonia sp. MH D7]